MRTYALFGAKTSDFSKVMVCAHGQGGVNFSRYCADALYGRPLISVHSCVVAYIVFSFHRENSGKFKLLFFQPLET